MGKNLIINNKTINNVPKHVDLWLEGMYDMKDIQNICIDLILTGSSDKIELAGFILINYADYVDYAGDYVYIYKYRKSGGYYYRYQKSQ